MGALEKALVEKDPALGEALDKDARKRDLAMQMRHLRNSAGLSQAQLAEKAGLSQSHVAKIEAPYGGLPKLETLLKYASACGRDVMQLDFLTEAEAAAKEALPTTAKVSEEDADPLFSKMAPAALQDLLEACQRTSERELPAKFCILDEELFRRPDLQHSLETYFLSVSYLVDTRHVDVGRFRNFTRDIQPALAVNMEHLERAVKAAQSEGSGATGKVGAGFHAGGSRHE